MNFANASRYSVTTELCPHGVLRHACAQCAFYVQDTKGNDTPFLQSGAPGDKQQAPESAPNTAAPGIYFSSPQDPRSWDPYAKDVGVVITCISNGDAKKAEKLFNDLLVPAAEPMNVCPKCWASTDPSIQVPNLSSALNDIEEFLQRHEDISDGSDRPRPNAAMLLLKDLRAARRFHNV